MMDRAAHALVCALPTFGQKPNVIINMSITPFTIDQRHHSVYRGRYCTDLQFNTAVVWWTTRSDLGPAHRLR